MLNAVAGAQFQKILASGHVNAIPYYEEGERSTPSAGMEGTDGEKDGIFFWRGPQSTQAPVATLWLYLESWHLYEVEEREIF